MTETQEEKMIDVVEDFAFSNQSEQYRTAFQKWRRRPKNRYGFSFTKNPKETSFSEQQAVIKETPASVERSTLQSLGYLLGCIFLLYLVIENVVDKVILVIMNAMGMRIDSFFLGTYMYGDERTLFIFSIIINLLKYVLPALVLQIILRFPIRVALPAKIRHPQQLLFGISLTMLLSAGLGMFCVSQSEELQKYHLISNALGTEDSWIVFYILYTIFVMPLLIEFFFHGCLFQMLRQFGDYFAIFSVSVVAGLLMHNLQDGIRVGMMTLTISYFVIRTGSFWTAVWMHIVHEVYMFALFYIETFDAPYSLQWWATVLLPSIVAVAVGVYVLLKQVRSEEKVMEHGTYLKWHEKAWTFATSMPMLSFILLSLSMLLIHFVIM